MAIYVSDSEYDFEEFESPGASPIRPEEEDYSLNPYEEEEETLRFFEEEEESSTHKKLHKILHIMDKLRELFLEILDEI